MRKLYITLFIVFCICFQLLVTYFKWEVYPFNPTTMYSHKLVYESYNDLGFQFVDENGEELKMMPRHIMPLDPQRLFIALATIEDKYPGDHERMNGFARSTFNLYKENKKRNNFEENYIGFKIYKFFWENKQSLLTKVPSKKILIGEYFEK